MSIKKDLNFEINILPILDILSALICFLLLTAVWVQVGTLDTRQAIGDNTTSNGQNSPSIWVSVEKDGHINLSIRDLPQQKQRSAKIQPILLESQIPKTSTGVNWEILSTKLQALRNQWPDLKTGIVRPSRETPYKDVIKLMDQLKKYKFDGVGLSPLG